MFRILISFLFCISASSTSYKYKEYCFSKGRSEKCRPAQFVNMAFDGCGPLEMWSKTREFAEKHNINFTYFVSGVFFLTKYSKSKLFSHQNYVSTLGKGRSRLGFAKNDRDIKGRYQEMGLAHLENHEIASHGMGHFYGGAPNRWTRTNTGSGVPQDWSVDEWIDELEQTKDFLTRGYFKVKNLMGNLNQSKTHELGNQIKKEIVGFRAPQLSTNDSLPLALIETGHKYNASEQRNANQWPRKDKYGIWKFPLALVSVKGIRHKVTIMDYNLEAQKLSTEQVINIYLDYFKKSYKGNRAPVNFGHHFTAYGGYIKDDAKYWYILKEVAKRICHLPEVRCTSFQNLEKFLSDTPAYEYRRFLKGDFPQL